MKTTVKLTSAQFFFLESLYALQSNHPEGVLTPTGYRNAVDVGGPGMQSMLRALIQRGLIGRVNSLEGEKITMIRFTENGVKIAARIKSHD